MSIWAEERRQGTDELLLTIPAADFDVVLGKYLAAVAIYIVVAGSFRSFRNLSVLWWARRARPGSVRLAIISATGSSGVAMLPIGMVASFVTGNLTVGFVLGVMFNFAFGVRRQWPT